MNNTLVFDDAPDWSFNTYICPKKEVEKVIVGSILGEWESGKERIVNGRKGYHVPYLTVHYQEQNSKKGIFLISTQYRAYVISIRNRISLGCSIREQNKRYKHFQGTNNFTSGLCCIATSLFPSEAISMYKELMGESSSQESEDMPLYIRGESYPKLYNPAKRVSLTLGLALKILKVVQSIPPKITREITPELRPKNLENILRRG